MFADKTHDAIFCAYNATFDWGFMNDAFRKTGVRDMTDYHRLDFSWTISNPSMKHKRWEGSWIFTVYNLYGRQNPYSVFFKSTKNGLKAYELSVFASPFVSMTYNFKFL